MQAAKAYNSQHKPAVYGTWWPDGKPARYYAGVICRLRPDLREEALSRVPELIRGLVEAHINAALQQNQITDYNDQRSML